jgi:hypothetical protein
MDTSPVRTANSEITQEYTAFRKRIKGESENISGKVPENELKKLLTAEIAEHTAEIAENARTANMFNRDGGNVRF